METAENVAMNETVDVAARAAAEPKQMRIRGIGINADLRQRPLLVDGADTLVKLFARRCAAFGERTAHREKHFGIWHSYSWRDYYEQARLIGLGLLALGLKRGDVVSILSEDRKEWLYTDMGVQSVGGIASGIYTTDSSAQLVYLANDSGSKFLFVENDEQLDKYLSARARMPNLAKVIVCEREGLHAFHDDKVVFLDELYALGKRELEANPGRFEAEIAKSRPEDVALLVYTSGTTGPPKGAMLTHENLIFVVSAATTCLVTLPADEQICFLPLCHILERFLSVYNPICCGSTVNFAESLETVFDTMREVQPHVFVAVPRVWEKVYSRVTIMRNEGTWLGRLAYDRALAAGRKQAEYRLAGKRAGPVLALRHAFWEALVLRNMRRMLGMERLRRAVSGAAPICPDLIEWYWAIGVPLVEGYGQTEGTGLTSVTTADAVRIGTVGRAIAGADVRIAPGGEIQMKGSNVFAGYWGSPAKTAETMTADGWLKTGDVGHMDDDGFIGITGRLKDIIITAGGKNITPAEIENRLKFSPYISDAVLIGDRRHYLTALIMIDQENVEKFAQDNRIPFGGFASLCAAPAVRALIGDVVEDVNKEFARVEQIRDFRIIDTLLTAEDEELTATMKLKRSFVEKKYKPLVDQMYR
ncbi:MAG: AMP-dependent synthetase/ligase [Hyphomicrobiaceae bacterium]